MGRSQSFEDGGSGSQVGRLIATAYVSKAGKLPEDIRQGRYAHHSSVPDLAHSDIASATQILDPCACA